MNPKRPRAKPLLHPLVLLLLLLGTVPLLGAPDDCAAGPPDLVAFKADLVEYHDSGAYERDLSSVVASAQEFLRDRLARRKASEKLAVVLDIDETSLSNWPQMKTFGFGYDRGLWDEWVEERSAIAIGATLNFYDFARANGVAIFFVTGRREPLRAATADNLEKAGYRDWTGLVLKPVDLAYLGPTASKFAATYKTSERKKIVGQGYTIVVNIGDQQSDLSGGFAERTFKLPNPFYVVQ